MNRLENMIRLKQQGYSYAEIAGLYKISRQRVHQLISGYGKNLKHINRHNGQYWKIRNSVIKRDGGKCQKCGSKEKLVVHHINGNDTDNSLSNLITICNKCHLDLHRPKLTTKQYSDFGKLGGRGNTREKRLESEVTTREGI